MKGIQKPQNPCSSSSYKSYQRRGQMLDPYTDFVRRTGQRMTETISVIFPGSLKTENVESILDDRQTYCRCGEHICFSWYILSTLPLPLEGKGEEATDPMLYLSSSA